jgi:hypothetical protein
MTCVRLRCANRTYASYAFVYIEEESKKAEAIKKPAK